MTIYQSVRPTNPYSSEWPAFWAAHPSLGRGVGAEAAVVDAVADKSDAGAAGAVGDGAGKDDGNGKASDAAADLKGAASILDGDWREDLPDDLKETAKRFTSKADAVRAIVDFRKRESQVRVPGKNASPEETAAYHKAIGIPEKPELYEYPDLPEGMEVTDQVTANRAEWSKRFHSFGIPKEAAKALAKFANEDVLRELTANVEADKAFATKQEASLRDEWKGDEYERNKTLANRAFTELANRSGLKLDDLTKIETKDGRFLMDRAEIVRMFATIGREMSEGSIGPTLTESEKDTLDDQVRDVRAQIGEAQREGDSKRANRLYQREMALVAKKGGSQPIVGARGRVA